MKQNNLIQVRMSLRGALFLVVFASIFWVGGRGAGIVLASATTGVSTGTASSCEKGKYCAFLPGVMTTVPGDLVLRGIEVTQAVQNAQNSIPLVAGRKTILRIYANTQDLRSAVPNVKVAVRAYNASNVLMSDSPKTYSVTVPMSSSRADYKSSINIELPANWLSGTVNLMVTLDPDNAIREMNDNNNSITQRLVFQPVPPLRVVVVPVRYQNTPDGRIYPAPTKDTVSEWIKRTYPISNLELTWHATHNFTGNLKTMDDFGRLLNEITTIKETERAPESQVYYGLIPTTDGTSKWFSAGYAGLGWVGMRVSIGLDYEDQSSELAAHEIGHNLGMWHTPCNIDSGTEPNFPYSDGSIGQYGLDTTTGTVYAPSTKDVMSYCQPKWVSDFTYKKLFTGQVESGASAALLAAPDAGASSSQRGLLVRATIGENGVELMPAYVLPGQVSEPPAEGDYLVEVLGEQGEVIAQAPVRAYQAILDDEQGEQIISSIHALIALPDQPATGLRLSKDGKALGEQPLKAVEPGQASAPVVAETAEGYSLRWNDRQGSLQPDTQAANEAKADPVLVRYTTDGGKTWTTIGVDVAASEMALPESAPKDAVFEVIAAGNWK